MNQLKRIALLTTGGTIAGTASENTATANYAIAQDGQALLDAVPELNDLAQIECHSPFQIDSSTISTAQQVAIVVQANQLLARPDIAGVVITHGRSEEHTSELQSRFDLVCRLLLEKK